MATFGAHIYTLNDMSGYDVDIRHLFFSESFFLFLSCVCVCGDG